MADHAARQGQFTKKVVASGAVLAAGAALLSGGIYAGWTSQGTVDQGVGAVDLSAGFLETGGEDHVLDSISNAFPGDHWTRYATLSNDGSIDQDFAVRVDTLTDALTAETDGLLARVTTCAVAFAPDGSCEIGDYTVVQEGYNDPETGWVEEVREPNPDDDAVEILADGFITDQGRDGANVSVAQQQQLWFKIAYKLHDQADQATFEGQQDTALVQVTSLTAQRAGQDRTDG